MHGEIVDAAEILFLFYFFHVGKDREIICYLGTADKIWILLKSPWLPPAGVSLYLMSSRLLQTHPVFLTARKSYMYNSTKTKGR